MRFLKHVLTYCAKIVACGRALATLLLATATLLLATATLLLATALPVALAGYVFGLGFWLALMSLPI